jgi:ariadne-1
MLAVEEALVLEKITTVQRQLILYPLAEGRMTEASRILSDLTEKPVIRRPIAMEKKKRRAKDQAFSLALEQKTAFNQAIEIGGRTFARNPYTGEITTPKDAEMLENSLQTIADKLEAEEERKQQSDIAKSEEFARKLQAEFDSGVEPSSAAPVCQICLTAIRESDLLPLDTCGHLFHPSCIQQHLEFSISESKFPIQCPFHSCSQEVSILDIKERLSEEMVAKFEEFSFKHFVGLNKNELFCCPTPDCKYVFQFACEEEFTCPVCGKHYCLKCQVEFHEGMTCEQYRKVNSHLSEDDQFLLMVQGSRFKQCPNCKFWVEKAAGCDHMVCRCKFEFCYQCGGVYGSCPCKQQRVTRPERHRMRAEIERRERGMMRIRASRRVRH